MSHDELRLVYKGLLLTAGVLQIAAFYTFRHVIRIRDSFSRNFGVFLAILGEIAFGISRLANGWFAFVGTVGMVLLPLAAIIWWYAKRENADNKVAQVTDRTVRR